MALNTGIRHKNHVLHIRPIWTDSKSLKDCVSKQNNETTITTKKQQSRPQLIVNKKHAANGV